MDSEAADGVLEVRRPAWVKCDLCGGFLCMIHRSHADVCDCPPIEEWGVDPYSEGGPEAMKYATEVWVLVGPEGGIYHSPGTTNVPKLFPTRESALRLAQSDENPVKVRVTLEEGK